MELKPGALVKITFDDRERIFARFKGWTRDPIAMKFEYGGYPSIILKAEIEAGWLTIQNV